MPPKRPKVRDFNRHFKAFFAAVRDGALSASDFKRGTKESLAAIDPKDSIANSADQGLYYVTDAQGNILYIGLAGSAFGKRFWRRHGEIHSGHATEWSQASHFHPLLLKTPTDGKLVLMAALEAFLIARLRPPLNRRVGGAPIRNMQSGGS